MASSLLPDPLDLLRRAVTQLENQANTLAGRGLQTDTVVRALHQLTTLALTSRQLRGAAMDGVVRALNLPTSREFGELMTTLRRIEDKLDRLLPVETPPPGARPARTRRPPPASTPADSAAPRRGRTAAAAKKASRQAG